MAQETRSHSPNLDTILIVEEIISKKCEFASRRQLQRALPRLVQYPTFRKILEYLEESNRFLPQERGFPAARLHIMPERDRS